MKPMFFAAIKLVSGEEILSQVKYFIDSDEEFYLLLNPIEVDEVSMPGIPVTGLKITPWMKFSDQDHFVINKKNVITITELTEKSKELYINGVKKINGTNKKIPLSEEFGFKGTVEEARRNLERIFRSN